MTKKEAIKVLRTESVEIGGNAVSVCRFWEALDMAIAALREQEGKDTNAPTNADRIRAMSDEELAEQFVSMSTICEFCVKRKKCEEVPGYKYCMEGILDWLQQPAEEDHDERKENENV